MNSSRDGWRAMTLADWGVSLRPGFASGQHHREQHGVIHLRPMNITRDGNIDFADAKYVVDDSDRRVSPGDVLFNNTNSPALVGKTASVGMIGDFAYSNHMTRLRAPQTILDSRFLARQLHWRWLTGYFESICSNHVNQASVSSGRLAQVELSCPDLREQKRIVDIVEEHLAGLDAAESSLVDISERARILQQASIDATMASVIGQRSQVDPGRITREGVAPDLAMVDTTAPVSWASLEGLTDSQRVIRYGILKPQSEGAGEVPYVEVRDLKAPLVREALKRTTRALDEQFSGARLRSGDVLIAVRGSFERTRVVPVDLTGANISRDVARIAPLPGLDPWFLHYWLQCSTTKRYLHAHARGVAVKGVNISTLRAMPVPIISVANQRKAVQGIRSAEESALRAGVVAAASLRRSRVLRQATLTAAFSGRLTGASRDLELVEQLADTRGAR